MCVALTVYLVCSHATLSDSTVYFSTSHKSVGNTGVNGTDKNRSHSEFAVLACGSVYLQQFVCFCVYIYKFRYRKMYVLVCISEIQ